MSICCVLTWTTGLSKTFLLKSIQKCLHGIGNILKIKTFSTREPLDIIFQVYLTLQRRLHWLYRARSFETLMQASLYLTMKRIMLIGPLFNPETSCQFWLHCTITVLFKSHLYSQTNWSRGNIYWGIMYRITFIKPPIQA